MLKTKFGVLQYLFGRGDKVWEKLSIEERQILKKANLWHNVERDDYKNPEKYGDGRIDGGESWDSREDRLSTIRGKILNEVLEKERPEKVLEIGPGPGFFTKLVCQKEFVKKYVGLDIAQSFLDYLSVRLHYLKNEKRDFSFELLNGDFYQTNFNGNFDFILLSSTAHHIPNRAELFQKLASFLMPGGAVLLIDPSHYWPRKLHLLLSVGSYFKKSFYLNIQNLSTHHMLTLEEYKRLVSLSGLTIDGEWYILPQKFFKKKTVPRILRFLSGEMAILLKKP